jgi:hypothetical protein
MDLSWLVLRQKNINHRTLNHNKIIWIYVHCIIYFSVKSDGLFLKDDISKKFHSASPLNDSGFAGYGGKE